MVITKANKPFRKENDSIFLVKFGNGDVIRCTSRHMLMCEDGWRELDFVSSMGVADFTFGLHGTPICETVSMPISDLLDPLKSRIAMSGASASGSIQLQSVEQIEEDGEVWDFEVPVYANYFIGDILNHNSGKTTTVCAELTYHLTGVYPDDWKGVKYTRPVDIWIAGETNVRVS